jgi:predicted MFS family arabinose efflux permease
MIQDISLPWAFRITAIVTCVLNVVCAFLMKDRNQQIVPNQKAFDLSLLQRPEMLLIISWASFSTLGYTMILYSLPDNTLKLRMTVRQGAITGALANLGMGIGRPIVGFCSDRFGRLNIVAGATFACTLCCFCIWTSAISYAQLLVFSFLGGSVLGTWWAASHCLKSPWK